jgi:polar amino acid transport system substrate-binding protein
LTDIHAEGAAMSAGGRGHARRLLLTGLLLTSIGAVAACGSGGRTGATGKFRSAHAGTLTVATAFFPAPGFWEGTPSAPTGGLEWDLAHTLAKRFHLTSVSVTLVPFADLVAGNLHGADLALSELTPTAARRKVLDFTAPYLLSPPGVVVRPTTSTPDEAALRALRWVAVKRSTLTDVVNSQVRPSRPALEVDGRPQALKAIDGGTADAMLLDLPVAVALAKAEPSKYEVSAQLAGTEGLAAALPRHSSNVNAVDTAIRALVADGTVDKLSARWLGVELSAGDDKIPLIRTEH